MDRPTITRHQWPKQSGGKLFDSPSYIFGPEFLAILAIILAPPPNLVKGKCGTFCRDNKNARQSIISGYSKSTLITEMVKIFWYHAQSLSLTHWIEWDGGRLQPDRHSRQEPGPTFPR